MPTPRRRRPTSKRIYSNEAFEERVAATLESQDRVMARIEEKLEKPVLNGGFDSLVAKVDKIETVSEGLRDGQASANTKIDAIHTAIYDPEKGLYTKVKDHSKWIENATKVVKWVGGLVVAGLLTGAGKLLYDVVSKHIHFSP